MRILLVILVLFAGLHATLAPAGSPAPAEAVVTQHAMPAAMADGFVDPTRTADRDCCAILHGSSAATGDCSLACAFFAPDSSPLLRPTVLRRHPGFTSGSIDRPVFPPFRPPV